MNTLAFDGRMGASGDMLLGALIDAGADPTVLRPVEDALEIEYDILTATRNGISGTNVIVQHAGGSADTQPDESESAGEQDHSHEQAHDHAHANDHGHAEGAGPHRSYPEVIEVVESLALQPWIEENAKAIFELLGEAEAAVHGTDLTETHFHEVGADDAIADIVGVVLLLEDLDPAQVLTTPLATGGGTVSMSHGEYPVPTPAVVELAEQATWTLRGGPIDTELLTPTGAAIMAHVADGVETLPPLNLEESGYGLGDKQFDQRPNVLRVLRGTTTGQLARDSITVLETNVDDVSPEVLGNLQESLTAVGARDVSIVPLSMKKSRPGHLVKVITKPEDAERVAAELARQTGTLGIREHGAGHRFVAEREQTSVTIDLDGDTYDIAVKIGSFHDGTIFDVSPEFDDAAQIASETGRSVREILQLARQRAEADR